MAPATAWLLPIVPPPDWMRSIHYESHLRWPTRPHASSPLGARVLIAGPAA
jgi:hypothetical protein